MPRIERAVLPIVVLAMMLGATGCFRRTFVVVPHRAGGYTARDTLYAQNDGRDLRVLFRHDTTWRTDTVRRTDTLWRGGTRIIRDTLWQLVRDTVFVTSPTTGGVPRAPGTPAGTVPRVTPPPRRDTVYLPDPRRGRDTVYLPRPGTGGRIDTVRVVVRDTIRLTVRDTIRVGSRDTVRVVVRDTVLIARGRRLVFVPPGQFPNAGLCRVWIHDRPPGQQSRPAPCDQLGQVPAGAFVLFNGDAWDIDHDWISEAQRSPVPPEIVAIKRRNRP